MNLRPEQYNPKLIDYVIELLEDDMPLDRIITVTGLEYEEIMGLLTYAKVSLDTLREYIPNLTITDDKAIICSDTHIGSKYENRGYIEMMLDYAIRNNITSIIHGGDLLHSNKKGVKRDYDDLEDQINHFLYYYSAARGITNYILLGNHDVHLMKRKPNAYEIINNRKDLKIIGVKKAYFEFSDLLVAIYHKIDKYKMELPNIPTDINLHGHRHECRVKDDNIWIPTLSDDVKMYFNETNAPGFLVMNDYKTAVGIDQILISNRRISKRDNIYVKNKTL